MKWGNMKWKHLTPANKLLIGSIGLFSLFVLVVVYANVSNRIYVNIHDKFDLGYESKTSILEIRRHEKNYLLRKDKKWLEGVENTLETLKGQVAKLGIEIKEIGEYESKFNELVNKKAKFQEYEDQLVPIARGVITKIEDNLEQQHLLVQKLKRLNAVLLAIMASLGLAIGIFLFMTSKKAGKALQNALEEIEVNSMELALGLSETFEGLQKIAAGDPTVRVSEDTENELLAKLGAMVNQTAEGMEAMVKQSHELAMGICENFEVLRQISEGELNVRAAETSENELMAKLGGVINQTAANLKKTLGEVKSNRAQLQQFFDGAASAMRVIDKDFKITMINQSMEKLTGIKKGKTLGKKCYEQLKGPLCNTDRCTLKQVLAGEEIIEIEVEKEVTGGKKFSCLLKCIPFKDNEGNIIGIIEDFRDITRLKQIERELEDSNMELALGLSEAFDVLGNVSKGNLLVEMSGKSSDELISKLGVIINQLVKNLQDMISKVTDTFIGVDSGAKEIEKAYLSIGKINGTISDVVNSIANFSSSTEQITSSVLEMSASIDQVAGNAENLSTNVDETSSSIEEMTVSIKQVAGNAEVLVKKVDESASAIKQIIASINEVEISAVEASKVAEQVTKYVSEKGQESVIKTVEGMDKIKDIVLESATVIKKLGEKSEDIGEILEVIDDVAEQTNLLALNAAIIAAQAGEHGKGFAVVADEIRELAERTASSTKEIATLIKGVQEESKNAVLTMENGSKSVEEGVKLVENVDKTLKKVIEDVKITSETSKSIAIATIEQSKGSKQVLVSIDNMTQMAKEIAKATQEQTRGSEQIIKATENMRDMSVQVKKATVEQSKGSKQISEASEGAAGTTQNILQATRETKTLINDSVESFTNAKNILAEQVALLKKEIDKFKINNNKNR